MVAEPDGGDGLVLAQSETPPSVAPSPAATEMADASESQSSEETERTEQPEVAAVVPLPQRKPTSSAGTVPAVRTVKVVTIDGPAGAVAPA